MMYHALQIIAAGIVLAEALNKLERTDPLAQGLIPARRLVLWIKSIGWFMLALGSAGSIVAPLIGQPAPELHQLLTTTGFALLIVRSRLCEALGSPG